MMYEEMDYEELLHVVFDLECEKCEDCPVVHLCGKYELFWGCSVWEDAMGEDL